MLLVCSVYVLMIRSHDVLDCQSSAAGRIYFEDGFWSIGGNGKFVNVVKTTLNFLGSSMGRGRVVAFCFISYRCWNSSGLAILGRKPFLLKE